MRELFEKLLSQGPREPDIEITFDPNEIRRNTFNAGEWVEAGRRKTLRIFLPVLFGLGLAGLAFDYAWVSHLAATILVVGLLTNIGINTVVLVRMKALEAAGKFDDVAEIVFTAKSGYWFHRELEEDARAGTLNLALAVALIGGCFLVTWYFTMAVAALSVLSDAHAAHYVNVKGKGLVDYKKRWDELQAKRQAEAEEVQRQHDEMLRDVLGDEPNALEEGGPVYRDPNDHSDIKYEDDDGTIREG